MPNSTEPQPIEYRLYVESDAEEMIQLLGEVFSRGDPPAVAVGATASEFCALVRLFCRNTPDKLTIVARHTATGRLVGALFVKDFASALPTGLDQISDKFDPIFAILGEMDEEYQGEKTFRDGEAMHLLLLGVADAFTGQGVAKQLVASCLDHGRRRGYQLAITEATGKVSQHIFRELGFIERVRRSYKRFQFDGCTPFASVAEQGGPMLMDRSLGS